MGFPVGLQIDASKRPRTGVPDSDASEAGSSAQNNHQRGIAYVTRPLLSGRNVVVKPIVEAIDHSFDRGTLSSNGVAAMALPHGEIFLCVIARPLFLLLAAAELHAHPLRSPDACCSNFAQRTNVSSTLLSYFRLGCCQHSAEGPAHRGASTPSLAPNQLGLYRTRAACHSPPPAMLTHTQRVLLHRQ